MKQNASIFLIFLVFLTVFSGCIEESDIFYENSNIINEPETVYAEINADSFEKGEEIIITGKVTGDISKVTFEISKVADPEYKLLNTISVIDSRFELKMNTKYLESGDYVVKITTESGIYEYLNFEVIGSVKVSEIDEKSEISIGSYDSEDYYLRTYSWDYGYDEWTWELNIPKSAYDYYTSRPHDREDNYAQYALSDYDKTYLDSMVQSFKEVSNENGYSDYDTVLFIISFVQSLEYTSDDVTTGYDEYPRYPIETLVDMGGDCEDTSILTAALLNELGYDVVLIELPGHMAVGINGGEGIYGSYYEYNGNKYYYVETTGENWDIGEIPSEYEDETVIIRPLVQIPRMSMSFSATGVDYDSDYVYYRVTCNIENIGSGLAKNPKVNIAAMALEKGEDYIWVPDHTIELDDYSEGDTGYAEATLRIPRYKTTKIRCILYGDNFETVETYTEEFET